LPKLAAKLPVGCRLGQNDRVFTGQFKPPLADKWETDPGQKGGKYYGLSEGMASRTRKLSTSVRLLPNNTGSIPADFPKKRAFSRTFPEDFPNKRVYFPNNFRRNVGKIGEICEKTVGDFREKSSTCPELACHFSAICLKRGPKHPATMVDAEC